MWAQALQTTSWTHQLLLERFPTAAEQEAPAHSPVQAAPEKALLQLGERWPSDAVTGDSNQHQHFEPSTRVQGQNHTGEDLLKCPAKDECRKTPWFLCWGWTQASHHLHSAWWHFQPGQSLCLDRMLS